MSYPRPQDSLVMKVWDERCQVLGGGKAAGARRYFAVSDEAGLASRKQERNPAEPTKGYLHKEEGTGTMKKKENAVQ